MSMIDYGTPLAGEDLARVQGWAAQMIELTTIRALDYDLESVRWADGYVRRCRDAGLFRDPGTREGFVTAFGAFLGECLIRVYGGAWVATRAGAFGVRLDETSIVFPFGKVSKFLDDDADSIASFFEVLPLCRQLRRDPEGHGLRVDRLPDAARDTA